MCCPPPPRDPELGPLPTPDDCRPVGVEVGELVKEPGGGGGAKL